MRYDVYNFSERSAPLPLPIIITGIPASGKTTLALDLCDTFKQRHLINAWYEKLDLIYEHKWSSDLIFFELFRCRQANHDSDVILYDGISVFKAAVKEPGMFVDYGIVNSAFIVIHCSRIVTTIRAIRRYASKKRTSYKDKSAKSIIDGYLFRNKWIKSFNRFVSILNEHRSEPDACFDVLSGDLWPSC